MGKALTLSNVVLVAGSLCWLLLSLHDVYTHTALLRYTLLQVALAAAFLAALRLTPSSKINLMLVLISTAGSLYLLEFSLSVYASWRTNTDATLWLRFPSDITLDTLGQRLSLAKKENRNFDTRSRLEVIDDLRKEGIEAYPAVFPTVLLDEEEDGTLRSEITINGAEALPLGGISGVTTVFCNESGEYTIYDSDEHGFHNPKGLWKATRMAIVAVGDSFTHGACVPSNQSFIALIRDRYPATLNLGIDDSGPLTMLAMLKEYGRLVRPTIVLWFYYEGNDLKDLRREKSSPLLMKYLTGAFTQDLVTKQEQVDRSLIAFVQKAREAKEIKLQSSTVEEILMFHHLRHYLASFFDGQQHGADQAMRDYFLASASEATNEELDLFRTVLMEANAYLNSWGGKLYFVYLPEWARYAQPELANKDRERVLTLVGNLALPLIDIHSSFTSKEDPLALFPFRRFGHYNPAGHRLVAEAVLKGLLMFEKEIL